MKIVKKRFISSFLAFVLFIGNATIIHAEESQYEHYDTATEGSITLRVEWNDPVLGQETTFHVSATGGSGNYKFRMEAPSYTDPDVLSYESVADPSRGEWLNYTEECSSHDYTFTMMASGTYNFRFYVMDKTSNMNYLRTNTFIQVSSPNYPSVNSIIQSTVAQCNAKTDGSSYAKALWLHDWLLNQLDYDKSLKWSSAESALTRGLGTCQSYESAYSKLLTAAGIENSETRDTYDGHTWNAVKIDGEWYQVDCTWDDSNDLWYNFDQRRLYFGLTDELMSIAHPGHAKIYTKAGYGTRSTNLANNYFVKSGEAAKWVASYKDRIQENLNDKNTEFSIQADNSTYPPSIYGIQNGIIAYVMNQNEWFVNGKKVELIAKTNDKQFDFTVTYSVECTNHDWNEGVITTEPTCTTEGIRTYTCKNCLTTKTDSIKPLEHNYSTTWTVDQKATCQQEGSKSHHCNRCDSKTDVTVISKVGHSWDKGTIVKNPTYSESGIKRLTCTKCGNTKDEVIAVLVDKDASILYKTYVQDYGWQDYVSDGKQSGTSGQSKRLEGIQIKVSSKFKGDVEYQTYVQDIGWQEWKSNGAISGTSGKSKKLEAVRIKLTGEIANKYDVYYRVHCQDFGWLGWAKNGESSGSEGCSKRLEGIEIRLVRKGETAPGSTNNAFVQNNNTVESASISYRTDVQDYGWQDYVSDGKQSGTSGQSKRLEGIQIKVSSKFKGDVEYQTYVQDIGWQEWKSNGAISGTSGKSKKLEAVRIKLTGEIANKYDVYYRVHCQDFGWLGWAKNGESSGSEGYSKRLEAIEIRLVPMGQIAPGNTNNKYYKK